MFQIPHIFRRPHIFKISSPLQISIELHMLKDYHIQKLHMLLVSMCFVKWLTKTRNQTEYSLSFHLCADPFLVNANISVMYSN